MWSEVARRDLARIIDYLADENPAAALRVLAHIEKRAAALDILPERGRVVPELARLGSGSTASSRCLPTG